MTKKQYFKTISLIEAIYIDEIGKKEKEKILIQRDWSQYFDFEIFLEGENILVEGIKKYFKKNSDTKLKNNKVNEIKKEENKRFIGELKKLLENKNDLYNFVKKEWIFDIKNKSEKTLNNRIYSFNKDNKYKKEFNDGLKGLLQSFKFSLDKNIELNLNIEKKEFCIQRKFNFEDFLYKNEALFLGDNDFFGKGPNTKTVRNIIGKLKRKEKDGTKIDIPTIENMIKKGNFSENGIKEENIFRININFEEKLLEDGKKENKIEFLDEKKDYNFVFWERNNFLVFDVKTNNG